MVATLAGAVSALSGPAAPIVIPIAASLVFAKWVYDVYRQSYVMHFRPSKMRLTRIARHDTLRRLMAYVVDLTLIMQNIFWLMITNDLLVTRRLVKLAFKAYDDSEAKAYVHVKIGQYVKGANIRDHANRDKALDVIIELINYHRIDSTEMFKLKGRIGIFDGTAEDEEWDPKLRYSYGGKG